MTIIAIEGIDGAGKNTLAKALAEALGAKILSFPQYGKTFYADQAAYELKKEDSAYTPMAMATLFALDRFEAIPKLKTDDLLIVDRYTASNQAYTTAITRDMRYVKFIAEMEEHLGIPKPDFTILIGTDPEEASRRAESREVNDPSRKRDRYETNLPLQAAVFETYRALAYWNGWHVTDPSKSLNDQIESATQAFLDAEKSM